MGRLKTGYILLAGPAGNSPPPPGTPPRLDGRTIDYSRLEPQGGDARPQGFSFLRGSVQIRAEEQILCHSTRTTSATHVGGGG
jgi:tRNA U34 5-carboxymethylaminomethyl modifying enzyme MnmG/GidA